MGIKIHVNSGIQEAEILAVYTVDRTRHEGEIVARKIALECLFGGIKATIYAITQLTYDGRVVSPEILDLKLYYYFMKYEKKIVVTINASVNVNNKENDDLQYEIVSY